MRKSKKGGIVMFFLGLILLGVLLGVVFKYGKLLNAKVIPNPTVDSKDFNFYADKINIINEGNCTPTTPDAPEYNCKKGKYIRFKTEVRNEYNQMNQLKLYGGFIACPVSCTTSKCIIVDKACFTNDIITSTIPCYVSKTETRSCDGGTKMFSTGTYFIYPLAKCDMDKTYGCYKDGMVKEIINSPNTYIKVKVD